MGMKKIATDIVSPSCGGQFINHGFLNLTVRGREASKFTYQWLRCKNCRQHVYGILEEYWEVFDDDYSYNPYYADSVEWQGSYGRLGLCPNPQSYTCKCWQHSFFRDNQLPGKLKSFKLKKYLLK